MTLRIGVVLGLIGLASTQLAAGDAIPFQVKLLTVDANEGCDVADFDQDGKLDVVAGRNWFRNGDWVARPVRSIDDKAGYVHSNGDFAYDVNGDGRMDVIAGDFFTTEVYWYENPGKEKLSQGMQWPQHLLGDTGVGANEGSFLHDINGDGKPEWISNSWVDSNPLIAWELTTQTIAASPDPKSKRMQVPGLERHLISETGQRHGFGFGDINNDGRDDLISGAGWFEHPDVPSDAALDHPWRYHPDWNAHWSVPVLVRDLNLDGRNDLIIGNPHDFGLFVWYAEEPSGDGKLQFKKETIDDSYSQLHCLHLADLNGDGEEELITGKRVRAHNGNDPGGKEPAIICYYQIQKSKDGAKFTRHIINDGDVGIGLQIRTADLEGDGDTDIVAAGKEGTQVLLNQLKP